MTLTESHQTRERMARPLFSGAQKPRNHTVYGWDADETWELPTGHCLRGKERWERKETWENERKPEVLQVYLRGELD